MGIGNACVFANIFQKLFTVLAQVVARISHSNHMVSELLTSVVVKTLTHFPRQGLWSVLALVKSSSKERASKGITCLNKIIVC
jgi:serine/threonine-protein kinase ATR